MKTKSLKLKIIILIILIFALVTGCAQAGSKASVVPTAAPTSAPTATTAPAPTASPVPTSVTFPIPTRYQWDNANGYCGETSIQSIALYYGAWIPQQKARNAAGGELLVDENAATALKKLKLDFEEWDYEAPEPQFKKYMLWLKSNLVAGYPCITVVFLADSDLYSEDYDHIVPVVGVKSKSLYSTKYMAGDSLIFHTLYDPDPIVRKFSTLASTRDDCDLELSAGGNIPQNTDYGIAIKGLQGDRDATLPTRLSVNRSNEPNVSLGEKAKNLKGTITVSALTPGAKYALLRYDDVAKMPTSGGSAVYLASDYDYKTEFIASGSVWEFKDPVGILSSGVTYYRCVRL